MGEECRVGRKAEGPRVDTIGADQAEERFAVLCASFCVCV